MASTSHFVCLVLLSGSSRSCLLREDVWEDVMNALSLGEGKTVQVSDMSDRIESSLKIRNKIWSLLNKQLLCERGKITFLAYTCTHLRTPLVRSGGTRRTKGRKIQYLVILNESVSSCDTRTF